MHPLATALLCNHLKRMPALLVCHRYRSLSQETSAEGCRSSALQQALAEEHTAANASLYVLLRAADRFHAAHGRYPGSFDSAVEDDVAALKGIAVQLLQELGVSGQGVQVGSICTSCWVLACMWTVCGACWVLAGCLLGACWVLAGCLLGACSMCTAVPPHRGLLGAWCVSGNGAGTRRNVQNKGGSRLLSAEAMHVACLPGYVSAACHSCLAPAIGMVF